jgi:hypothetical protein
MLASDNYVALNDIKTLNKNSNGFFEFLKTVKLYYRLHLPLRLPPYPTVNLTFHNVLE